MSSLNAGRRLLRVTYCRPPGYYIALAMSGKGVTLYTAGTTNGWKASILLEELQLPYKVRLIDLSANEQKEEWYLKINPNGRIPAIGNALFITHSVTR